MQGSIIAKLNQYLKRKNRRLLDEEGQCNGLSAVFLFYCANGKLAEFKQIVSKILKGELPDDEMEDFIGRVELGQNPGDYPFGLTQQDFAAFFNLCHYRTGHWILLHPLTHFNNTRWHFVRE